MEQEKVVSRSSDETVDDRIRNAGYDPEAPEGVSDDLKREVVSTELNRSAEIAHVDRIEGSQNTITVTYTLPYGGSFEHVYERPDKQSSTDHVSFQTLLDRKGLQLDEMDDLIGTKVDITRDASGWVPTHTITRGVREERRRYGNTMLASRLLVTPLCAVLAFVLGSHLRLFGDGGTLIGALIDAFALWIHLLLPFTLVGVVLLIYLYDFRHENTLEDKETIWIQDDNE